MFRRLICSALMSSLLSMSWSCTSLQTLSKQEVIQLPSDKTLVIRTEDRFEFDVSDFRVYGDSLKGMWMEQSVRFDLNRLEWMGVRKFNPWKTVAYCGLCLVGATLIVTQFKLNNSGGDEPGSPDSGDTGEND